MKRFVMCENGMFSLKEQEEIFIPAYIIRESCRLSSAEDERIEKPGLDDRKIKKTYQCDEEQEPDLDRDYSVGVDHGIEQLISNAESIIDDVKKLENEEALIDLKKRFLRLAGQAHTPENTFDRDTYNARAQDVLEMKRRQIGKRTM